MAKYNKVYIFKITFSKMFGKQILKGQTCWKLWKNRKTGTHLKGEGGIDQTNTD